MDIASRKIEFVQKFLKLEDSDSLSKLEILLKEETSVDNMPKRLTKEDLNKRIDQSESDFKNGKHKTTKELLAKFQ
ncbi:hypothetical protein [Algoriphagus aquimarinus]|uniref:Addiction module component n=1 Tax=Algoriphagus aquimarinus TaxID=237018 RepID=A0A1I1BY46_9BACT|nr:hypothetical protein [Algoriphagus aquimarinus]SFB55191.1 hypothetical protein SAMN04489723_11956 [Algoriphagus aquimarinus]